MLKNAGLVSLFALPVALIAVLALQRGFPVGPTVLGLSSIPVAGMFLRVADFRGSIPDLVFGAMDTGLLVIPALWGGIAFGVAGAIAGGVVGDALTDAIAGFFEGAIDESLRKRGFAASREAVTTALGKMAGCLLGAGVCFVYGLAGWNRAGVGLIVRALTSDVWSWVLLEGRPSDCQTNLLFSIVCPDLSSHGD